MKTQHFLFHVGVMGLLTSYAPIQVLAGGILCSECNPDIEIDNENSKDTAIQGFSQNNQTGVSKLGCENTNIETKP